MIRNDKPLLKRIDCCLIKAFETEHPNGTSPQDPSKHLPTDGTNSQPGFGKKVFAAAWHSIGRSTVCP